MRLQPGRLRVHVHPGQPPVAQEHARQRRRRRTIDARRRRRPEPQLRDELGPRRRGLVGQPGVGDLPRPRPGLRARDPGDEGALGPGRLRVPEERPHGGRAAAVAAGLPAVHADPGQRDLRGAGRRRRRLRRSPTRSGTRTTRSGRSPATGSTRTCRPSCTSPTATRSTTRTTRTASSATRPRARRRATRRHRLRVRGRRGGRSRPSSAATCCSRSTSRESAADPANPVSHMGNTAPNFYVDPFPQSWGDPQPVQATAKRVARRRRR